jgi:hypothetical protein
LLLLLLLVVLLLLLVSLGLNDYLDKLGLGLLTQQLKDLDLGELMDTPPPGVDEAIAISKVCRQLPKCVTPAQGLRKAFVKPQLHSRPTCIWNWSG